MRDTTRTKFKLAVQGAFKHNYDPRSEHFPQIVLDYYDGITRAETFVADMLKEKYTAKHSEDKLATGFRK